MGYFSSLDRVASEIPRNTPMPPLHMPALYRDFFARAGLPWSLGLPRRGTIVLNPLAVGHHPSTNAALLPGFILEGQQIQHVDYMASWYITDTSSCPHDDSSFGPCRAFHPGATSIALQHVGWGRIGYVGDYQATMAEGSIQVIIAMCGLLD
ncbi:hypothetical protein FZEAL_8381 [Fusarium zealandicum]|uniref:Uncharacterized protein n=1 Tax=Fusarium zealandicum TaxID=1053134 RepID=A0A8H4XHQ2_9HYPO|nr:hypothetical protein FZEAL_8381 [Fusarium zealandicum]